MKDKRRARVSDEGAQGGSPMKRSSTGGKYVKDVTPANVAAQYPIGTFVVKDGLLFCPSCQQTLTDIRKYSIAHHLKTKKHTNNSGEHQKTHLPPPGECCGPENKPLRGAHKLMGTCLVCNKLWCRKSKTCYFVSNTYSRLKYHVEVVEHADETSFANECSYCEKIKDKSQEYFGQCPPPCRRIYCTVQDCDAEYAHNHGRIKLIAHYRKWHKSDICISKFGESKMARIRAELEAHKNLESQGSNGPDIACCSEDKKPPSGWNSHLYGKCAICGKRWCRISKTCNESFVSSHRFDKHKEKEHTNAISFKLECSQCGGEKNRDNFLFESCQKPCNISYCTYDECDFELKQCSPVAIKRHLKDKHNVDTSVTKAKGRFIVQLM